MDLYDALSNIGFDWRVALANLINFLIIFWLLKKFLFSSIKDVLEKRKQRIEEGIENAKKAERDRVMAKEKYDERMKEAQIEANAIISEARTKERGIVDEARTKAEEEAHAVLKEGREKIEAERAQIRGEVEKETADLVVDAAEKLFRETIDKEKNEKLIHTLTKTS